MLNVKGESKKEEKSVGGSKGSVWMFSIDKELFFSAWTHNMNKR